MAKPRDYRELPDIRDDAVREQVAAQYVSSLIADGKSPLDSIVKITPESWTGMPVNSIQNLRMAFGQTPLGQARTDALKAFVDNIELTLDNNQQAFQKIVNSKGEPEIDKILEEYANATGTPIKTLKGMIAEAKKPQPMAPPARVMPGAVLARDAQGNWTDTVAPSPEQQAIHAETDGDIMNRAANEHGWIAWATNKPEEVRFIYDHRTDLPAIHAAAKSALEQTGHLAP